jgi:RNA polymerase sigma-70 factor (ECF subfamily)
VVGSTDAAGSASADDLVLVRALRAGDEQAFIALVERYQAPLLRVAMLYVRSREIAEEVVQDTWIGVLQGLERFEGRSSLKTWIFRILMNRAMSRGEREQRSVPFSALWDADDEGGEPTVDPSRFAGASPGRPGAWAAPPQPWDEIPEDRMLSRETLAAIGAAIDALRPNQREVVTLRDVEGWTSAEVCAALAITEANQRVLLHRGRAKVRRALEGYLERSGLSRPPRAASG